MLEFDKILLKITLLLVALYFIILLFCGCKSKKIIANKLHEEKQSEIITNEIINEHEQQDEITLILDSVVSIDEVLCFDKNEIISTPKLKVKEIRLKKSNITRDNQKVNEITIQEKKTAENEEKRQNKGIHSLYVCSFVIGVLLLLLFLFIKSRRFRLK